MTDHSTQDITRQLSSVLRGALGADVTVQDVTPLRGGASSQLWSFSIPGHGAHVLRLASPIPTRIPLTVEAAAMTAARSLGVPAPRVLMASDDPGPLGVPHLVMEFLDGDAHPRTILLASRFAGARQRFATDCGRILGTLARVDPSTVPGLEPLDQLERYRAVLAATAAPMPTFAWAFRTLEANRPDPRAPVVVHGDFRLGNLLIDERGVRGVLDWELAHLGDPVEDLGWLCAKTWRFGGRQPVGGIGRRTDLLDAYEHATGIRVDLQELAWWEAFAALKWGVICLVQASRHLGGAEPSVELAAIGRRTAEAELDLLQQLGGGRAWRRPPADPTTVAPNAGHVEDRTTGGTNQAWHRDGRVLPHRSANGDHPDAGSSTGHTTSTEEADALGATKDGRGRPSVSIASLPTPDPVYGTPTAAALLGAVRDFLHQDVLESITGHTRYLLQVAIHVIDIVRRECEQRPGATAALQTALAELGVTSEATLADAIWAGALDSRADDLQRYLHLATATRLEVANPRYLHGHT